MSRERGNASRPVAQSRCAPQRKSPFLPLPHRPLAPFQRLNEPASLGLFPYHVDTSSTWVGLTLLTSISSMWISTLLVPPATARRLYGQVFRLRLHRPVVQSLVHPLRGLIDLLCTSSQLANSDLVRQPPPSRLWPKLMQVLVGSESVIHLAHKKVLVSRIQTLLPITVGDTASVQVIYRSIASSRGNGRTILSMSTIAMRHSDQPSSIFILPLSQRLLDDLVRLIIYTFEVDKDGLCSERK